MWPIFYQDVDTCIKACNICFVLKTLFYKSYKDLQFLLVSTNYSKDLSIDLITGLPLLIDWKSNNYNKILVIIDSFIKIMYYKSIKSMMNVAG